jgi:NitT/TauT family transport system substrate-binding protein
MITRRSFVSAIAAAAAAPLFAHRAAAERWGHAIVKPQGDAAFAYMAEAKGFWAEFGVTVDLIPLRSSRDVLRTLLAGEVDSAEISPADVLPAIAQGAPLRFVGAGLHGCPYGLYVRPEIDTWAELAGKTFGFSATGAASHLFALTMLHLNGVPTDTLKATKAGRPMRRIEAVATGRLDATVASGELLPVADALEIKMLATAQHTAPLFPRFCQVMHARTLERRREAGVRFLAGTMEGLRYCVDHREEAIALSAEINDEEPDARYTLAYDQIVDGRMVSPDLAVPRAKIAWMQDMMLRIGRQERAVEIDRCIDHRLREKALTLVGRREDEPEALTASLDWDE